MTEAQAASVVSVGARNSSVQAPRVPAERFPSLDGYRALAALAVLVYHVCASLGFNHRAATGAYPYTARLGDLAVAVFFLLSGFLLYRPYVLAHFDGGPPGDWRRFLWRRALRIFPAYWVALTALFFLFRFADAHGAGGYLTFYGLVQTYRRGIYAFAGLSVAWSLCIEVSFYLALPVLAWVVCRLTRPGASPGARLRVQLIVLMVLFVTAVGYRWYVVATLPQTGVELLWLPAYLDWFALGMLLAVGRAWVERGRPLPSFVERLAASPGLCWLFALEVYWLLVQVHIPRGFSGVDQTTFEVQARFLLPGFAALLLLVPGVLGDQNRGTVRRALRSVPLRSLGLVSYGIYLWHPIVLEQVMRWVNEGRFGGGFVPVLLVVACATIAIATASYWIVEKPALSLKNRGPGSLARRHSARRLPSASSPVAAPAGPGAPIGDRAVVAPEAGTRSEA